MTLSPSRGLRTAVSVGRPKGPGPSSLEGRAPTQLPPSFSVCLLFSSHSNSFHHVHKHIQDTFFVHVYSPPVPSRRRLSSLTQEASRSVHDFGQPAHRAGGRRRGCSQWHTPHAATGDHAYDVAVHWNHDALLGVGRRVRFAAARCRRKIVSLSLARSLAHDVRRSTHLTVQTTMSLDFQLATTGARRSRRGGGQTTMGTCRRAGAGSTRPPSGRRTRNG